MQTEQKQKTKRISDPVKAVIAVLLFFVFAAVFIGIIILPDELVKARNYDTVIVGSSVSRWGMNAEMLDKESGRSVINLSSGPSAMPGRYEALKGALERYHPDTVILEVCYESFNAKDAAKWSSYNKVWIVPRMVTLESALKYCVSDVKIPWYDYGILWGAVADQAYDAWNHIFHGNYETYARFAGSKFAESVSDQIEAEESVAIKARNATYNETRMSYNQSWLEEMLKLCQEQEDLRVILVSIPESGVYNWYNLNLDLFLDDITQLAEQYNYEYYDFNLYKGNVETFDDHFAFRDVTHLTGYSSLTFSKLFAQEVLNRPRDKVTITNNFYQNYEELRDNSIYKETHQF